MAADIYTKGFSDKGKWTAVCWLINVVDPKVLKGMIQYNKEVKERLDAEDAEKAAVKAEDDKKTPKEKATAKAKSKAVAKAKSANDAKTNQRVVSNPKELPPVIVDVSVPAIGSTCPHDDVRWRGVIEICAREDSVLGQETPDQEGCEVTRITVAVDFTKPDGVNLACESIRGPNDVVWTSLPCTGGCPWQYVNAGKSPELARRIEGYWALFGVMWRNLLKVFAVASEKGATLCIEWPKYCRYWYVDKVKRALAKYGLVMYRYDGCQYGITSIVPKTLGQPIKKPGIIATTSPIIGKAFSRRCQGKCNHAPCEGRDTPHTEGYSVEFASVFHKAWREHCITYNYPTTNALTTTSLPDSSTCGSKPAVVITLPAYCCRVVPSPEPLTERWQSSHSSGGGERLESRVVMPGPFGPSNAGGAAATVPEPDTGPVDMDIDTDVAPDIDMGADGVGDNGVADATVEDDYPQTEDD